MATRSKATFQKRQKEMKRQEKQRMKAERRMQKKLAARAEATGAMPGVETMESSLEAESDTAGFEPLN
jgi:hypothetical protein